MTNINNEDPEESGKQERISEHTDGSSPTESEITPSELLPLEDLELPPDFDLTPEEQRKFQALIYSYEEHKGPLPHPKILSQYNDIVPGCAEVIIQQFEDQGNHRRYLEKRVIDGDVTRANWGLVAGFVLGIIGLTGSFYVIVQGYSLEGLATFAASLAPLVGAFIYVQRKRKKELEIKEKIVPEKKVGT